MTSKRLKARAHSAFFSVRQYHNAQIVEHLIERRVTRLDNETLQERAVDPVLLHPTKVPLDRLQMRRTKEARRRGICMSEPRPLH